MLRSRIIVHKQKCESRKTAKTSKRALNIERTTNKKKRKREQEREGETDIYFNRQ